MHNEIIEYVKKEIANNGRKSQPFRDRFQHTMRVYAWAQRLQALEGGDLKTVQIAALFHDAGWDDVIPHQEVSATLARDYLTANGHTDVDIEKVVQAVANHNQRTSKAPLPIECYIVMDADFLDEIGAITVLWDSMSTALESDPSYLKAYERLCHYFEENKSRECYLRTESGKRLYRERLAFLEHHIRNLEFELGLADNVPLPPMKEANSDTTVTIS
ncbi:MAG TPA: HD domain-containing protein [Firmicutes bacterium]|nr:HD domain-containing protein [Bacillota bacterium]